MSDKVISSTTQEFLDVYDIVNDMVLLKDGTASMILQVGTMNFSLLAEQEQDAIIFTYGSLLNSLNYPIQINIQSQTKDVTKYLRLLDEQIKKASSDRKSNLIKKYREFVAALIKERNVLQKNFFVTIPASPTEMGLITASNVLPGKTAFDITTVEKSIILEKAINLLGPRRDHLTSQFSRLGLYTRQLSTQEIIQNFYISYNPEAAEGQEISSSENYTTPLVRASFGRKIMQTNMPDANNQAATMNSAPTPDLNQAANETKISNTDIPIANNEASVVGQPAPSSFSAENILSDTPIKTVVATNEWVLNQETIAENPVQQPAEPLLATPEQTQTVAQEAPIIPPVANSIPNPNQDVQKELNLNLDSSLINEASTEPTQESAPLPTQVPTQEVLMTAEPAATEKIEEVEETASNESFSEEVPSLQSRLEDQPEQQATEANATPTEETQADSGLTPTQTATTNQESAGVVVEEPQV